MPVVSLIKRIQAWDSRKRTEANQAILQSFSVEKAEQFVRWYDHGFLRRYWTNLHVVAPGVFRSNYPNGRRFAQIKSLGIKSILNLRGGEGTVPFLLEQHYCDAHGIVLHTVNLNARRAPEAAELLALLDLFDNAEKPFLMHCKSGADRAGLASALYLLHTQSASIEDAQSMLSFKYLHVNDNKTGIMGHVLRAYGAAQKSTGISLRSWLSDVYDPVDAQQAFDKDRKNSG